MHLPVRTEEEEAAAENRLAQSCNEAKLRSYCEDVLFLGASAKSDSHVRLLASKG